MPSTIAKTIVRSLTRGLLPALLGGALTSALAQSVDLADRPLFSQTGVPGNLMLALSVEWPTANTPAYLSTTPYAAATSYLGYFDPRKCYQYNYVSTNAATSYFSVSGAAVSGACSSTTTSHRWSGNYLNWAAMQSLDVFRWALTGGDRAVDTASETILEKTRHSGQGSRTGLYPDKTLSAGVSGATPFSSSSLESRVHGMGTFVQFSPTPLPAQVNCTFSVNNNRRVSVNCTGSNNVSYNTNNNEPAAGASHSRGLNFSNGQVFNCITTRSSSSGGNNYSFSCVGNDSGIAVAAQTCAASATYAGSSAAAACSTGAVTEVDYTGSGALLRGVRYRAQIRVKACDAAGGGAEANCKAYGSNRKPEGLMQEYAMQLRYGAFGYLNDDNVQRDGGVLRARMKSVGPQRPVPGSVAVTNANAEWSATTGVMSTNPDTLDAANTTADATAAGYAVAVTNSGVINYLNRFGKLTTENYKSYDPVGEMYYAATRYFRNLGNVSSYTSLANAGSQANLARWIDGFPVIRNWNDPVQYSCQKNFILGIGDVYTHRDRNLPGSTITSTDEPAMPSEVTADGTVNVAKANAMVQQLEGGMSTATTAAITDLATHSSGRNNSYYMVGLAYDAHTKDIRSDFAGTQTISTYWLDVRENQRYESRNQFWLAAKYGGFTLPDGFAPYAATNGTTTIGTGDWYTNTDTLTTSTATPVTDRRPDNYFFAADASMLVSGLRNAFARIASENDAATSTSFSTSTARVSRAGTASYASTNAPRTWTGDVVGSELTYSAAGVPGLTLRWNAAALLDASTKTSDTRKIVTCCNASNAAIPFRDNELSASILSSRTYYDSFSNVPGVAAGSQSAANFVAYLRGDRTKTAYRNRASVLGDIVGSRPSPVGRPQFPYADQFNPDYGAFKSLYRDRKTVVYVGANDGMVHAFDGALTASTASPTPGEELFAFIPSFVYGDASTASTSGLAALGNPSYSHRYYVDSTPQNFDVDFRYTSGSNATAADWRTLLIGGLGKGGKGYYALDITDPTSWTDENAVKGKFLWEFPRSNDATTIARMGYSYNEPMVVKTAKYDWTVIFTSGYNNSDGVGYIFLVNPRTGDLLETIATPEGTSGAPLHMTQANAFVPLVDSFVADSIYAGDMRGNLWRFDLTPTTGAMPAPTKLARLADAGGNPQPVTVPPVIDIDPVSGKRYVVIGTGRLLADSDIASSQGQTLYAIADGTREAFYKVTPTRTLPAAVSWPITRSTLNVNTDLTLGIGSAPASEMGWYFDLSGPASGASERVTTPMAADGGQIAVPANTPNAQPCEPGGTGRLLVINLADGRTALRDANNDPVASSPSVGLIDTVAFVSISGKRTVLFGTGQTTVTPGSSAQPCPIGPNGIASCEPMPTTATLKRLNWREVQTAN
jgi:type IV pilus assembly protein PilY1